MKRIYLDSNVFISLVRDEIGRDFTLLSENSRQFISVCCKRDFVLILSLWFFDEVEKIVYLKRNEVVETLRERGVKFEIIESTKIPSGEIMKIMHEFGLHHSDSHHVALARASNCDMIVTWNKKDFEKAKSLIDCKTPKEFIQNFSSGAP